MRRIQNDINEESRQQEAEMKRIFILLMLAISIGACASVGSSVHFQLNQDTSIWTRDRVAKADALKMTRNQIMTLASIIQVEAGSTSEMRTISSVFHNRLAIDMPLQSDATVSFGLGGESTRLTKDDLNRPSPYNTYLNKGLPPGPIASPTEEAIDAALNPSNTNYLYFFSRGNGTFQFSETLKDHKAAAATYALTETN